MSNRYVISIAKTRILKEGITQLPPIICQEKLGTRPVKTLTRSLLNVVLSRLKYKETMPLNIFLYLLKLDFLKIIKGDEIISKQFNSLNSMAHIKTLSNLASSGSAYIARINLILECENYSINQKEFCLQTVLHPPYLKFQP